MHLSRLKAPKHWKIKRKERKWIARTLPGPHALRDSINLNLILKNLLDHANTTKEVKNILNKDLVLVDNKVRKEHRFGVGLMDIIAIPSINKFYRVLLDKKGGLMLYNIKKEEATLKPCKLTGKTMLKNKKIQLNFYDGKNKIVEKDGYKVGDTLVIDLNNGEIKDHLKFEKNALIYLIKGKYASKMGVLEEIKEGGDLQARSIVFKIGKDKFETRKDYAFVIGKDKPVISLPGENE